MHGGNYENTPNKYIFNKQPYQECGLTEKKIQDMIKSSQCCKRRKVMTSDLCPSVRSAKIAT